MRRTLVVLSLLVAVAATGGASAAVADDGPQINDFGPGAYVVVDANTDATPTLSAHLTAGTNPITSAVVDILGSDGSELADFSLTPGATTFDAWTGSGTIPWTAVAGLGSATLTVSDGVSTPVTSSIPFAVERQTKLTLAFSPAAPSVAQRYSVVATLSGMNSASGGAYTPISTGMVILTNDGVDYSRPLTGGGTVSFAAPVAAPTTSSLWAAHYGGADGFNSADATLTLNPTLNVTRIINFNAGPEPAYRHGGILFSGDLQYVEPNTRAWHPYAGKVITITRGTYSLTTTTTSSGHFSASAKGVSSTVDGVWRASFAGTPTFLPTTSGGDSVLTITAPMRITHVVFDSPGSDLPVTNTKLNGEYVRLTNEGIHTANLYGWTLRDRTGHVYTITHSVYVAPGHNVYIHTGRGTDTTTQLYWDSSYYIWNNSGDTAYLRSDINTAVDSCAWSGTGSSTSC